MRYARIAFLALVAIAALILIAELVLLVIDARRKLDGLGHYLASQAATVQAVATDVHAIQLDTTRTEAEMAGLLNQTRHSMMTPTQTAELVNEASQLILSATQATDEMSAAANSLKGIAPEAEGAISQLAEDSHEAIQGISRITVEAQGDLNDPSIQLTTAGLARTAENTAATTKNLADTTADIKAWVHTETTPERGTWHAIKAFLFELAGPLAQVATAAK